VLEEGNETRSHGNELLRRDIHVLDLLGLDLDEVSAITRGDSLAEEFALAVEG
jgi:hypothetical protein